MKKFIVTVLAFFYLGLSSGMTVHFHYCMDKLVDLGFSAPQKAKCSFCGMLKKDSAKKSCCKDDYKQAKVDHSQKPVQVDYDIQQLAVIVLRMGIWESRTFSLPLETGKVALSNAPPERQLIPVFIRNCTYRI